MAQRGPGDVLKETSTPATRVGRRRSVRHQRLLAIAARRFAVHGLDGVPLDAIADEADIARGTLYSHFPTKEALVAAVVQPVLECAVAALGEIEDRSGTAGVDALISIWLDLWRDHADAMRVVQHARAMPLGVLASLHGALMQRLLAVFRGAAQQGGLRTDDPALAARIVARVAVPLLEICGEGTDGIELFRSSMHGLLLRS
jgi:AcrR family transcriptional regulator